MRVEVLSQVDEVAALADDWDRLVAHFDAPVIHHDWVLAALEHLVGGEQPAVVCVFDGADLAAAAPLSGPRGGRGPLEFAGQHHHAEPAGVLFRDAEALDALVGALIGLRRPAILRDVLADSPFPDALAHRHGSTVVVRPSGSCPTLELTPEAGSAQDLLSSSLRSDLRRAHRRASEFGEASFTMHGPVSPEDLKPLWEECLRVEASGWKGRSGTALRDHEALGRFFGSYVARAAEHKHLRIGLLEVGGTTASALVATEWAGRLWLLKIGYDERFSAASPGMLLLEGAVDYAVARHLGAVEFLGSAAPWTRRWTRVERSLVTVRAYPRTVGGMTLLGTDAARGLLGRVAHRGRHS